MNIVFSFVKAKNYISVKNSENGVNLLTFLLWFMTVIVAYIHYSSFLIHWLYPE